MSRKLTLAFILGFILLSVLVSVFKVQKVKASGTIYIRADGSIYPPTAPIQRVDNRYSLTAGIFESIVIEKDDVVLDGKGFVIQGIGEGAGIDLNGRRNVEVRNIQVKDFFWGFYLSNSEYNNITHNNVTNNTEAIFLWDYSSRNNIIGNNLTGCYNGINTHFNENNNNISGNTIRAYNYGIDLHHSSSNYVCRNRILANKYGIYCYSSDYTYFIGNIVESANIGVRLQSSGHSWVYGNRVWNNTRGIDIRESWYTSISSNNITKNDNGIKVLNCANISISNSIIRDNIGIGVEITETWTYVHPSENNKIYRNSITNNTIGISLSTDVQPQKMRNNKIWENNITNNHCGISLSHCSDNLIYHNNFLNNTNHVLTNDYYDAWDDGYPSGGNYWSDYNNTDLYSGPYQNETGSDGIGDTPFTIEGYNVDRYPLMEIIPEFPSFLILPLFMITTLLAVIIYRRKNND